MDHTAALAVRWMTRAEAADHLRISPRQFDRMRLPRSYLAGTRSPRFRQSDIDAAMTAATVTVTTTDNNVISLQAVRQRRAAVASVRNNASAILATDRQQWFREMKRNLAA